jgi:hypothetical protein
MCRHFYERGFISQGQMPKSEISGSNGKHICSFAESYHTHVQSGCAIWYPLWQITLVAALDSPKYCHLSVILLWPK